jgi:ATP-dependent RNA helicase DDX55/SPB4
MHWQWDAIPYLDKTREAQRLAALQIASETTTARRQEREVAREQRNSLKKKNGAWSDHVARAEARDTRKEKRGRKREWLKKQKYSNEEEQKDEGEEKAGDAGGSGDDDTEDWEELKAEERMAKKAKRGNAEPEMVVSYEGL